MREVDRALVVGPVASGDVRQAEAARQLGLSVRRVKRLVRRYRERGARGLVSGHRRGHSNNARDAKVREASLALVRAHYRDFGPTLASEKLEQRDGIRVSRETLRKWMIAGGLWEARRRKSARIHQSRPRRSRPGELVRVERANKTLQDRLVKEFRLRGISEMETGNARG